MIRTDPFPTLEDIRQTRRRITAQARQTPLLSSPLLDERLGGRILVKAECLQTAGSFKLRGALSFISMLEASQREKGVVTYSSGNHAQAVACVAKTYGIPAIIVMPADAPTVKIERTRAYGAQVVFYERNRENRREKAEALAAEHGMTVVPPSDHPLIIAGQGTAALEALEQCDALGLKPDMLLAPCSGGGLVAGCAIAAEGTGCAVYAVEPEGYDDTRLSLEAGHRVSITPDKPSICDALLLPEPGELTFAINKDRLAGSLVVSDDAVEEAMTVAFEEFKIVLEPGGASGLAAVLAGKINPAGRTIIIIGSGGNTDARLFSQALTRRESPSAL